MKQIQKSKKSLNLKVVILLCIVTAVIVISLSISKYESKVKFVDSTTVALMASDVYAPVGDEIKGYPGCDPYIYEIVLTNKESDKICEVSQKYAFSIEREDNVNLPIQIALYKDIDCTELLTANQDGFYESNEFKFDAGQEQSRKFYLKVTWPESYKNPSYTFEIDYFRIHVLVDQID